MTNERACRIMASTTMTLSGCSMLTVVILVWTAATSSLWDSVAFSVLALLNLVAAGIQLTMACGFASLRKDASQH